MKWCHRQNTRKRGKQSDQMDSDDWLSNFPNCIIPHIGSLMDTQFAMQTASCQRNGCIVGRKSIALTLTINPLIKRLDLRNLSAASWLSANPVVCVNKGFIQAISRCHL